MNWKYSVGCMCIALVMNSSLHSMEKTAVIQRETITLLDILTKFEILEEKIEQLESNSVRREEEIAELVKTFDSLLELCQPMQDSHTVITRIIKKKNEFIQRNSTNTQPLIPYPTESKERKSKESTILIKSLCLNSLLFIPLAFLFFYLGTKNQANQKTIEIVVKLGRDFSGRSLKHALALAAKQALTKR